MKRSWPNKTDLSLLFLILVWGVNYSFVKNALVHFYPLSFNGLRFAMASSIIYFVLKKEKRKLPAFGKDWPLVLFVGILGNTVYQILFVYGIHATLAGNTSLILATTPVFVALFSFAFGMEKIHSRLWIGTLASFTGVGLVVLGGKNGIELGGQTFHGDMIVLIAGILWSLYIVFSTPLIKRHGTLATTASTMWVGTVFLFAASIPFLLRQNWGILTWQDWGELLFSAVLSIALGQILWYNAIGERGQTSTSVYSNITPLVGVLFAWPLAGERPHLLQFAGAAAILIGVFLSGTRGSPPAEE